MNVEMLLRAPDLCPSLPVKISPKIGQFSANKGDLSLAVQANSTLSNNEIVLSIPAELTISVYSNLKPNQNLTWSSLLSLELHKLKKQLSTGVNDDTGKFHNLWLNSLPPAPLKTPFHFPENLLKKLHYPHMEKRVQKQRLQWTKEYESIEPKLGLTYDEFVWGCEIARSRAFSSNFIPPFDFKPYAFTCVLVAFTVFGGYGSLEQAANGAAVVVCANLLKDFVIPKIAVSGKNEWGTKRYVIAPGIDLCQHSNSPTAAVAFEYFSNTFSLSTLSSDRSDGSSGGEDAGDGKFNPIEISYGARSNDSLFQYYGFVLEENPHDVYVLPSVSFCVLRRG